MDGALHLALSFPTQQDTPQLDSAAQIYIQAKTDVRQSKGVGKVSLLRSLQCARPDLTLEREVAACREANGVSRNVCHGHNERCNLLNISVVSLVTLIFWGRH